MIVYIIKSWKNGILFDIEGVFKTYESAYEYSSALEDYDCNKNKTYTITSTELL